RASVLKGAVLSKKRPSVLMGAVLVKKACSSESVLAEDASRKRIRILRHGVHAALFLECTE
ncbi:MAG: hypothetical protein ACR2J4_03035, partial [Deinococcus sp.]